MTFGTENFLVSVPVSIPHRLKMLDLVKVARLARLHKKVQVAISQDQKSKSRSRSRSHETQNKSLSLGLVFETTKYWSRPSLTACQGLLDCNKRNFQIGFISDHIFGPSIQSFYEFCLKNLSKTSQTSHNHTTVCGLPNVQNGCNRRQLGLGSVF